MSKGKIGFGSVKIEDATIVSVEKGNVLDAKIARKDKVLTIAVRPEGYGKNVKLILKGELAAQIYDAFLKNGASIDKTDTVNGVTITRVAVVSYEAFVREEREFELVLQNPTNMVFDYKFEIR